MIRFKLNDIRKLTNDLAFMRGVKYFNNGHVKNIFYEYNTIILQVEGTEKYDVILEFAEDTGNILYTECNCPAFEKYYGACKHIVAGLLYVLYKQDHIDRELHSIAHYKVIESFTNALTTNTEALPKKIVNLDITVTPADINKKYTSTNIQFRIGEKRLYVMKNVKDFIKKTNKGDDYLFGKDFTFNSHQHTFNEIDGNLLHIVEDYYMTEDFFIGNWSSSNRIHQTPNHISLPENYLVQFFQQLENLTFSLRYEDRVYKDVQIMNDLDIPFNVNHEDDLIIVSIDKNPDFFKLVTSGHYVFFDHDIYKLDKEKTDLFDVLINTFDKTTKSLTIKSTYKHKFVSSVLPVLNALGSVKMDSKISKNIYKEEMICEIYLDKYGDSVKGTLSFNYGEYKVGVYPPSKPELPKNLMLVQDIKAESKILSLLRDAGCIPNQDNAWFTIYDEEDIYDFIYYYLPKLQDFATIYYSEEFQNMPIHIPRHITGGIKLNEDSDMLEFTFDIDDIDTSELSQILNSIKERKRYYKLKNGGFLPLDNSEMKDIGTLIQNLHLTSKDFDENKISIPKYRALYIDAVLKNKNIKGFNKNKGFKKLVKNIRDPEDMDFDPPKDLDNILRDYQRFGYKWLKTLSIYGFGGILADDMGLGKTLQSIALIKSCTNAKPSLVVAPTSLIYNWADEIEKFAPDLKVSVIRGNKTDRRKSLSEIDEVDVLVTSYGLLKRDIDDYEKLQFEYCFIDEAQHIKNPNSLNAKTTKLINAKTRFALTGTPIENSLTELWSIFDFILPGYLSSHNKFINLYERPIIKHNDQDVLNELTTQIKPFILRRLKEDVLTELPPKIETKLVTELLQQQKKLYLAYLEQTKKEIQTEISSKGFNRSTIKILSALTRLRQICCHPSLFIDDYQGDSGKLELLKEIILDAVDSGHRILIFSQFTSMLKLIEEMLKENNITNFYLDGSTKPEDRRSMVHDFNKGENDTFLISLKAGGTGLNLTGADMVIHYDPWWNPAVEDQATDRAYRIGQNKSVQVIKLITNGTIEEKIYQIQQKKKSIIDSVIKPGETLLSKLSEEEVRNLFDL